MKRAIRDIHRSLKKTHPHIIRKVTGPFKYKYPKSTVLGIFILAAYLIFRQPGVISFFSGLDNLSYLGIFIAGLLFSYGFTTPFAIGLFLTLNPENIPLAVIIGGIGGYVSDFIIFKLIKTYFMDEFREIEKTKAVRKFAKMVEESTTKKVKIYLLYVFSGLILASPLPDEFGVALLTGLGHIRASMLTLLSISTHMLAVMVFLLI